jgi:hypothetical protein
VVEEEAALKNLLEKKMADSEEEEEVLKVLHLEVEEDLTDQTDLRETLEGTEDLLVNLEENVKKINR